MSENPATIRKSTFVASRKEKGRLTVRSVERIVSKYGTATIPSNTCHHIRYEEHSEQIITKKHPIYMQLQMLWVIRIFRLQRTIMQIFPNERNNRSKNFQINY